jgi:protease-4
MRRRRVVILALVALAVAAVWLARRAGPHVEPGSALVLDLEGEFVEAQEVPVFARLLGQRGRPFAGLLSELAKVERDDRIATVVLRLGNLGVGWGKAQEIRAAIVRLREKGRRVVAHVEVERYGANLEYYVACAADEVYLAPATRTPFAGLAAEYFFLGGLWEKLGVEIEVERVGAYKSAAEVYAGKEMSGPHREMAEAILDSIESQFVAAVAEARDLTPSEVRAIIDRAPATAQEIAAAGLADGVAHYDEVVEKLGRPPIVEGEDYAAVDPAELGFDPQAQLALVYGSGAVVQGEGSITRSGEPVLASRTVAEALLDAAKDPEIDAILFRIDSPGGSALAADHVWQAAREARRRGKPLIVSFSDVAASGGYYVAAGADAIVASPATLTGSIGVFVLRPVLAGLLEKLGIGVAALTRGAHADLYLASRPLSPGSRERLRADVEGVYDLFVSRVAEGRQLETGAVDAVGRGRVWTGEQAFERGLVDALGGLRVAALEARKKLGLDPEADVALVPYPPPKPLAIQIEEALRGAFAVDPLSALGVPESLRGIAGLLAALPEGSPLLVPPAWVEVR